MTLPDALQAGIDEVVGAGDRRELERAARALSDAYRAGGSPAARAARTKGDVAAYLATRAPATFAAAAEVFRQIGLARPGWAPASILDLGAGPGIAAWAAVQAWPGIVDRHARRGGARDGARRQGARRARAAGAAAGASGRWPTWAARRHRQTSSLVSYVIGELEPATLARFAGARLVARRRHARDRSSRERPRATSACSRFAPQSSPPAARRSRRAPTTTPCPLPEGDWCHFATRLARSRTHRLAKGAERGFEDEKFAYAVLTRSPHPAAAAARDPPPRPAARPRRARPLHRGRPRAPHGLEARRGRLPQGAQGRLGRHALSSDICVTLAPCSGSPSSPVRRPGSARRPHACSPPGAGTASSSPAAQTGCARWPRRPAARPSRATSATARPSRRSPRASSNGTRPSTRSSTTRAFPPAASSRTSSSTSSRRSPASTTSAASG